MTFEINAIKCPQCGSTKQSTRADGHYVCHSCGAEFMVESSLTPKQHLVTHTLDPKLLARLGRFKRRLMFACMAFGGVLALLLVLLGGRWLLGGAPTDQAQAESTGQKRIVATTIYQGPAGPAWLLTATMASGRADGAEQAVLMTMSALGADGKGWQQSLPVAAGAVTEPVQFKRLPQGELYAVLMGQAAYRLDPGKQAFELVNPRLQAAFPKALGLGMSKVSVCPGGEARACLEVMSNVGVNYVYYPLLNQLVLKAEDYAAGHARVAELLQQAPRETHYFLTWVNKQSKAQQDGALLLSGMRPVNQGGPYRMGEVAIFKPDVDAEAIAPLPYLASLSHGYAAFSAWGQPYEKVREVIPGKRYFEARVLAEGEAQVLLQFDATPDAGDRFLQGIDRRSGKVAWTRPLRDFADMSQYGLSIAAEPYREGFLLLAKDAEPRMLIDQSGQIVKILKQ